MFLRPTHSGFLLFLLCTTVVSSWWNMARTTDKICQTYTSLTQLSFLIFFLLWVHAHLQTLLCVWKMWLKGLYCSYLFLVSLIVCYGISFLCDSLLILQQTCLTNSFLASLLFFFVLPPAYIVKRYPVPARHLSTLILNLSTLKLLSCDPLWVW